MLPILTLYLSPKDYGILALISSSIRVIIPFMSLGGIYAVSFEFFKKSREEFQELFSSVIAIQFFSFFIILSISLLLSELLGSYFNIPRIIFVLAPCLALFSILEETVLVLLRNLNEIIKFSVWRIGKVSLEIALTVYFVIFLKMNWEGRILSMSIVLSLLFLGAIYVFLKQNYLHIKKVCKKQISYLLLFGIPLIPDQLSMFALSMSDRFFIAKLENITEVGLYSVGSQIGMIIAVLISAFLTGFVPFQIRSLKKSTYIDKVNIVKISYLFLGGLIFVIGFLVLFTPYIFSFLGKEFEGGQQFVFWIASGYFFWAIYVLGQQYFLFLNKTKYLMYLSLFIIILNLGLNILLIKKYGTIGAAYSTTISYAIIGFLGYFLAQKVLPMPWLFFLDKGLKK